MCTNVRKLTPNGPGRGTGTNCPAIGSRFLVLYCLASRVPKNFQKKSRSKKVQNSTPKVPKTDPKGSRARKGTNVPEKREQLFGRPGAEKFPKKTAIQKCRKQYSKSTQNGPQRVPGEKRYECASESSAENDANSGPTSAHVTFRARFFFFFTKLFY